jgi:hypothetical protein
MQRRYRTDPKVRARMDARGRRRIYIGDRYCGYAKTADEARRINGHIRRRMSEFIQGQSERAKAEGDSAR